MLRQSIAATMIVFGFASAAAAHPPDDLADLVGANAGQSEGLLEARGYELTKGNNWWSAGESTCVHMTVSQGKYQEINVVQPKKCGMGGSAAAPAAGGCPVDVSEADRYKFPACK